MLAKLLLVKHQEVSRAIDQSMRHGAAQIVDRSRTLHSDPKVHARRLAARAAAAQQGNEEAWVDVVDCMSRLVLHTSVVYFKKWRSHLPAHASFDDVFCAGMEGLTIGVNKFDASKGYALTTYATNWIRTKVQRAVYAQCGTARIPEDLLQAGLDPLDPLVASAGQSLDYRAGEEQSTLGELLPHRGEGVGAGLEDLEAMSAAVELLRMVDERLPEVAELLERGVAEREIARIVRLPVKRVEELRVEAAKALAAAGLVPHVA